MERPNLVIATRNPSKFEQIRDMVKDLPMNILDMNQANIDGEAVEDGLTILENSAIKAEFAYERTNLETWTLADDTGFFINALRGNPGVHAARWAGDVPTEEITKFTLEQLIGAPDRSAYFETAAVLMSPEGDRYDFFGRVDGTILEAPRVPPQPKMPYSPIFVPNGYDKVWAEMTVEEENAISHRGKAFAQVRAFLEKHLN